ncbi:MAG: DUF1015 domain-containing protein [Paludibacteraceae bacterium]|nr:DUF1015 domain-containing protein [Paludibacteraceae bacterium]
MKIKPFRGWRPPKALVEEVSSRPYDVLNSEEARAEAAGNEKSLYHIIKPEINFAPGTDEHDPRVYDAAVEQFKLFKQNGWLVQDKTDKYYVYAQTMNGRTQYGLVVGAWVDDYLEGRIKKHELTRKDKEEDRMKHVRVLNANMEPVFFAYPHREDLDTIVANVCAGEPEYDFVAAPEGFRHTFWVVNDEETIKKITEIFAQIPAMYIADGHHRSAAAAGVGKEKKEAYPQQCSTDGHWQSDRAKPFTREGKGDKLPEYEFFLAVCFPDNQLNIIDYNRVVKDLNGLSEAEFLDAIKENFEIEAYPQQCSTDGHRQSDRAELFTREGKGDYSAVKPKRLHNFSLYLGGRWYSLTAKEGRYDDHDPIGVLDVTISSNLILDKILGIKDLRSDKRIDFVGGIRGLGELKRRVDSGEMRMALALYPVTMQQIIDIADSGNIMPPKTTWFEPKLRSGLVVHELS